MNKCKRPIIAIVLSLTSIVVVFVLYSQMFPLMNKISPKIYYRYGTDGKYDKEMFFTKEINDRTKILDVTISKIVEKAKVTKITRNQDIYGVISNNRVISKKYINENKEYLSYLDEHNLEVDDVLNYCKKMYDIDDNIIMGLFYLIFTILSSIFLFVLKYRKRIYIVGIFVYLFSTLSILSGGLFSQLFYYLPIINKQWNYTDYQTLLLNVLPPIKEAILTFIIVDSVFQAFIQNRNDNKMNRNYAEINNNTKYINETVNTIKKSTSEMIYNFKLETDDIKNDVSLAINKLNNLETDINRISTEITDVSILMENGNLSWKEMVATLQEHEKYFEIVRVKIQEKLDEINDEGRTLKKKNQESFISTKKQLEEAILNAKVVEEINTLFESMFIINKKTNLLALNASVEAARIGDLGSGFNVISKEMRNLAEQSKDTVREIQSTTIKIKESVNNLSSSSIKLLDYVIDNE
ncbi:methyl-accepting chemotaxis protein [Clostridium ljungdahlii]|uniref:Methyl-accepting chemotaxis protein 3 n=1 Tax=Clostridium ljungdahlii TaxID=1538 RepID=A0A168MGZ9_9CLOT|nr:methyl-accepting chemotaxis protein [Clostridium ljungdahlii]OAA84675.1 Methyl-accepting chemotaxis protein 3 [Clostridium ljungdahlii]